MVHELVTISYQDIVSDDADLSEAIYKAYGPNGLGVLTVSGIPEYVKQRQQLLPLSHQVAKLPEEVQKTLEDANSMYNAGWSFGKEKLGDKPDFAKGSYYGNPLYDQAGTDHEREKYPFFYPNNIWPTEHVPELESAFKNLGKTMYDTVVHLSKHIDTLVASKIENYSAGSLHQNLSQTKKIKGRLLYYYPCDSKDEDGWIGWHNDSGFLTALTSAMFFNDESGQEMENPDPLGGLWIVDRQGGTVHVEIPDDHLAIQCGECLQILSGGVLVATPHSVRPSGSPSPSVRVGRGTFPVFVDTGAEFRLSAPEGTDRNSVFQGTIDSKVPPLSTRWTKDDVTFVEFLGDTFRQYYEWNKSS